MGQLVQIPRTWLQQNISDPFKLPGLTLFDSLSETIETIVVLREKEDHPVLKTLEECLRDSTEPVTDRAGDIAQAEVWMREITNILLGTPDKNNGSAPASTQNKLKYR